jgi:hypothetical protein
VADTTWGSPTLGQTSIRLAKGSKFSGATFVATPSGEAVTAALPNGWHRGCDGVHGAQEIGGFTVATLTNTRFLNKSLFSWIPAGIVIALFDGPNVDSPAVSGPSLGIQLGPSDNPVITDIDDAVCTEVRYLVEDESVEDGNDDGVCNPGPGETCIEVTRYVLSFTAVIQFEK